MRYHYFNKRAKAPKLSRFCTFSLLWLSPWKSILKYTCMGMVCFGRSMLDTWPLSSTPLKQFIYYCSILHSSFFGDSDIVLFLNDFAIKSYFVLLGWLFAVIARRSIALPPLSHQYHHVLAIIISRCVVCICVVGPGTYCYNVSGMERRQFDYEPDLAVWDAMDVSLWVFSLSSIFERREVIVVEEILI